MKTVAVPKDFFRKERDSNYDNWREAFWRELISNSLDAGATRVHIATKFSDENLIVEFLDNGAGMSRDVVENVYMALGASTKDQSESSVGGFGRARILTCFSQEKYQIVTSDIVVSGDGAFYEVTPNTRSVKGTAITIELLPSRIPRLYTGLRNVLAQSSIRCAVTMNLAKEDPEGNPLPLIPEELASFDEKLGAFRFTGWSRKGREIDQLKDENGLWGTVHLSGGKTAEKNRAVVRVNGMAMYQDHLAAPYQLTIDLEPARAREVLTASRDSIRHPFAGELRKLISKIEVDQKTALSQKARDPETKLFLNASMTGNPRIGKRAHDRAAGKGGDRSRADEKLEAARMSLQELREAARSRNRNSAEVSSDALRETVHDNTLRISFAHHVGVATTEMRAAAKRYDASTWSEPGGAGRNAELLHAAWHAACRHALEALVEMHPDLQGEEWVSGFVFDSNYRAVHKELNGIRHGLLLNPVDEGGRGLFKLSDPKSMKKLISLALHEVCHCVHDWHNEDYAGLLTDLMGEIRDKDIEADIRAEVDLARRWLEHREEIRNLAAVVETALLHGEPEPEEEFSSSPPLSM